MSQNLSAHWSADDSRRKAPASNMPTNLIPATTSSLPNTDHSVQDNSVLRFEGNPTFQDVYAYHPGYLPPPSHAVQQLGTTSSRDYQYEPMFGPKFAQSINSHTSITWAPSYIPTPEAAQCVDYYQSAMGPLPFANAMSPSSQYAADDVPPTVWDFADMGTILSPGGSQHAHTYYEAQHHFPYDSHSSPSSIQPFVVGQPSGSPTPNDNAPSYPVHKGVDPLICDLCGRGPFGRIYELKRHKVTVHAPPTRRFLCTFCQSPFKRDDDRKRHIRTQHEGK